MRRLVLPFGVAALVAVAITSAVVMLRPDAPSPPVASDGWAGQSVLCAAPDRSDRLGRLRGGQVMAIEGDPAAMLRRSLCTVSGSPSGSRRQPVVREGHSYFVLDTGADRYDVTLVDVGRSAAATALRAELTVDGDGCASTDEYRGQLVLLIEGPPGAAVPEVTLDEVPTGC
jgi:hypothetical protein